MEGTATKLPEPVRIGAAEDLRDPAGRTSGEVGAGLSHGAGKRKAGVVGLLGLADLLSFGASVWATAALGGMISPQLHDQALSLLPGAPVLLLFFALFGLYRGQGPNPIERFRLRVASSLLFFAAMLASAAFQNTAGYPLLAILVVVGVLSVVIGVSAEGLVRLYLIQRRLWGAPVAIVGVGEGSRHLATVLTAHPEIGLSPVGFIEDGNAGVDAADRLDLPVVGSLQNGDGMPRSVEIVLVPASARGCLQDPEVIDRLGVRRLIFIPESTGLQSLNLEPRDLFGTAGLEVRRNLVHRPDRTLKRVIDLAVALPGLLVAAPIIGLCALAVKVASPGPAFYTQLRVGYRGQPLRVPKLRTMHVDAERRLRDYLEESPAARAEWERYFKLSNDPRIIPVIGTFLRRSSFDELPQLWNVVRGNMSLVGPRPFPTYHMEQFDGQFRSLRVSVMPGLTGLWQISSRSDGDLSAQKYEDTRYILNWSIWLDLFVILNTLPSVLIAKGAK